MSILDAADRILHVKSQLPRLGKKMRPSERYTMIQCPFHNDNTPSGRVSHNSDFPRSIGFFKCMGCGEQMGWNEFADRTGLEGFKLQEEGRVPDLNRDYFDEEMLGTKEKAEEPHELFPLDKKAATKLGLSKTSWRGFSFAYLRSIGGQTIYVTEKGRLYIYLPVFVQSQLRGYIKALPKKIKDFPGYLNAPGRWSHEFGLFMYDESVMLMERLGLTTMVLVEGPRDAMRLHRAGIPAVAILGTQSWSTMKVRLLEAAGVEHCVLCTDGDVAGRQASKLLYSGVRKLQDRSEQIAAPLSETFNTFRFPIEDYKIDPEDEKEKIDPFSMPDQAVEDLRALLE